MRVTPCAMFVFARVCIYLCVFLRLCVCVCTAVAILHDLLCHGTMHFLLTVVLAVQMNVV